MPFSSARIGAFVQWLGDPDHQGGHDTILHLLQSASVPFFSPGTTLTNSIKGNIGEFIMMSLGDTGPLSTAICHAANGHQPLSRIAISEVDILWFFVGATPSDDLLYVQEVKTTEAGNLSYADELKKDYNKLFGADLALTLHTRVQGMKGRMRLNRQSSISSRLSTLVVNSPSSSSQVRLIPSLVHDVSVAGAQTKMTAIRTAICGNGWPASHVECWCYAVDNLADRLVRLATGHQ